MYIGGRYQIFTCQLLSIKFATTKKYLKVLAHIVQQYVHFIFVSRLNHPPFLTRIFQINIALLM